MAVQLIGLPQLQYPQNAMLNFGPLTQALAGYRQGMNQAEQWPLQRNALLADIDRTRQQTALIQAQENQLRAQQEFVQMFRDALMGRGEGPGAPTSPSAAPSAAPAAAMPSLPGTVVGSMPSGVGAATGRYATGFGPQGTTPGGAPTTAAATPLTSVPGVSVVDPAGAPVPLAPRPAMPSQGEQEAAGASWLQSLNLPSRIGRGIYDTLFPPAGAQEVAPVPRPPVPLPAPGPATPPVGNDAFERLRAAAGLDATPATAGAAPAPPPVAPAAPAEPAPRPTTLQGVLGRMSPENRIAAMLLAIKGDYAELAKLIQGQTAGSEAADREFAKEYASWRATGGVADVQRQIAQLAGVQRDLSSGANITGPFLGLLPDAAAAMFNPQGLATRQRLEEVVQRSLRAILGAQFTENEATRLIARAFDPRLEEGENLRRVNALLAQIAASAAAKEAASNYFARYGTLRGWQGQMPTWGDFHAALGGEPQTPATAAPAATPGGAYTWSPEAGLQPAR